MNTGLAHAAQVAELIAAHKLDVRTFDAPELRTGGELTPNNIIEYLWQDWDGVDWINLWEETCNYDSSNNLVELLGQNYDGTTWINIYKDTYTYTRITSYNVCYTKLLRLNLWEKDRRIN